MAARKKQRTKNSTTKKSRPKSRGHWCWACGRFLANERFSGRGHSRHLCRQCAQLSASELAYRSAVATLERWCLSDGGFVRRKQKKPVQRLLHHADLRLRAWAEELLTGIPVGDHIVELTGEEFADERLLADVADEWADGEPAQSGAAAIDWFDQLYAARPAWEGRST